MDLGYQVSRGSTIKDIRERGLPEVLPNVARREGWAWCNGREALRGFVAVSLTVAMFKISTVPYNPWSQTIFFYILTIVLLLILLLYNLNSKESLRSYNQVSLFLFHYASSHLWWWRLSLLGLMRVERSLPTWTGRILSEPTWPLRLSPYCSGTFSQVAGESLP